MIPKSYTVGNFKSIGEAQQIDLRPITLLFGKNSAGKSSIIQSLLLCQHAIRHGNFNFTSMKRWGQIIDLGGFHNYVHRHETDRDLSLGFGFQRTAEEQETDPQDSEILRSQAETDHEKRFPGWSFSYFNRLSEISVLFQVGIPEFPVKGHARDHAMVKSIEIQVDGTQLISFFLDSSKVDRGASYSIGQLNYSNAASVTATASAILDYMVYHENEHGEALTPEELVREVFVPDPADAESSEEWLGIIKDALDSIKDIPGEGVTEPAGRNRDVAELLGKPELMSQLMAQIASAINEEVTTRGLNRRLRLNGAGLDLGIDPKGRPDSSRFEHWDEDEDEDEAETGTSLGKTVQVDANEDLIGYFMGEEDDSGPVKAIVRALRFDLDRIIDAVFDSLGSWLKRSEYIGPYRSIPGRFFQIPEMNDPNDIDHGYAILRKISESPDLLNRMSRLFQDTLESPYHLETRTIAPSLDYSALTEEIVRYIELNKNENLDQQAVRDLLEKNSVAKTRKGLYLVDTRTETDVDFCDVGFGIGQVLPLIAEVAGRGTGPVYIEQPEIHLHPKMQGDLGDVIVQESASTKNFGKIFLLETHSESLILRILRRIRETTEPGGKGANTEFPATVEDIGVHWVEIREGQTLITRIHATADGEFAEAWPEGFFEERIQEIGI